MSPPVKPGRALPPGAKGRKARAHAVGTGNVMGRPTAYRDEFPDLLVKHMAEGSSFWSFAAVAGVCLQTLAEWIDPKGRFFKPDFSEAARKGEALLLAHDERVASQGLTGKLVAFEVTKDGKGNTLRQVGKPARFNAACHAFIMKNRYPKLYRDRQEVAVVGDPEQPLAPAKPDELVEDQLARVGVMLGQLARIGVTIPGITAPPPAPAPAPEPAPPEEPRGEEPEG